MFAKMKSLSVLCCLIGVSIAIPLRLEKESDVRSARQITPGNPIGTRLLGGILSIRDREPPQDFEFMLPTDKLDGFSSVGKGTKTGSSTRRKKPSGSGGGGGKTWKNRANSGGASWPKLPPGFNVSNTLAVHEDRRNNLIGLVL